MSGLRNGSVDVSEMDVGQTKVRVFVWLQYFINLYTITVVKMMESNQKPIMHFGVPDDSSFNQHLR